MSDKFMRWAVLTALKLLYIIAFESAPTAWTSGDLRREIAAAQQEKE
mgnify:FL=1